MTHTIRRSLVWLHDGDLVSRRQHRTIHAERIADRRKQRRQARRADAAALADYYDDMDWLAKFDTEIMAQAEEDEYAAYCYDEWEDEEARKAEDEDSFDDLYDPYYLHNWPIVMVPGYGWDEWKERYVK